MNNKKQKRFDVLRGILPLSVLVFMAMGFIWGLWHPGWIVIVVVCFIDEISSAFRTGKLKISIYGFATIAFIVVGLVFGLWNYAWLIFVAAWVLDEMRIPTEGKKDKDTLDDNGNGDQKNVS